MQPAKFRIGRRRCGAAMTCRALGKVQKGRQFLRLSACAWIFLRNTYTVYVQYTVPGQLTLRIDRDSSLPAYRQIVDGLRILLVSGKLAPGSELPSVRRMARDLGVHFNTVAEAYRTLAEEGWLRLRHGRAARVVFRDPPNPTMHQMDEFGQRLRALIAEMLANGIPAAQLQVDMRNAAEELES
jgi:GntR family transcriptional regulator